MKDEKIEFKYISSKEIDELNSLSKNSHVKAYLKNHKELLADFSSLLEKKKTVFAYTLCSYGDKPISLMITSDVSKEQPDYMTPWIEPEKETLWIDFIFLNKEEVDPEIGSELLAAFTVFCPKTVGALLAGPEVKEESKIALYEIAGFTRVSTFIKGQGFFKGTSHYLMKLKI